MSRVGILLREQRLKLKISQSQICKSLGFTSGQYCSNWESDRCVFPAEYINKASKILKLDPGILIDAMIEDYREKLEKRSKQK